MSTSRIEVSPAYYTLSWFVLIAGFIVWLMFDGPASILIAFGIGLAYVTAMRPRRSSRT